MTKKKRIFFETEEVIHKTKRGYIDLDTDYFQFYNIAFHYMASLNNNCARDFVLWIMSRVGDNNEFTYNKDVFAQFLDDLSRIQVPKKYSEVTMHGALRELIDLGIVIRLTRGVYRVSPKLFWSDDTSKRITAIKQLESNSRVDVQLTEGYPLLLDESIEPVVSGSTGE
jgi:hypothetical protein